MTRGVVFCTNRVLQNFAISRVILAGPDKGGVTKKSGIIHRHRDSKKHHQFGGVFRYIYHNYFANE